MDPSVKPRPPANPAPATPQPTKGQKCQLCCEEMIPRAAAGGYAPEGFTSKADHWWCGTCAEVVMFDERPTNDEVRRQLGPTGKEKTR